LTLGTNDNTIRERFLPNAHWRALFVEPISINFNDLTKFLSDNEVSDRSHAIQAAVTNECASPTIIGYLLLGCSIIFVSFIICMLTLLLMPLARLHLCVGSEFVTLLL
jgi:hypothetical protein